jgi:hypothetical protein
MINMNETVGTWSFYPVGVDFKPKDAPIFNAYYVGEQIDGMFRVITIVTKYDRRTNQRYWEFIDGDIDLEDVDTDWEKISAYATSTEPKDLAFSAYLLGECPFVNTTKFYSWVGVEQLLNDLGISL